MVPWGVLGTVTQLPISIHWLDATQDGMHRYSHAFSLGKHLRINRALSKTSNLPNQLPMKYFGSKIRNYYFINNKVLPRRFIQRRLSGFPFGKIHLCLGRKLTLGLRQMQIVLQEHTNFPSKSSDIRLWMLLNLRKCEVKVLHNKCYCLIH